MGLGQGYVVIQFITWLQLRTEPHMLGRMMSVLLFAVVGLSPLSSTVAGALIQWSASAVMVGAGVLMVAIVGVAALSPSVWRLGDEQPAAADGAADAIRPTAAARKVRPALDEAWVAALRRAALRPVTARAAVAGVARPALQANLAAIRPASAGGLATLEAADLAA